MNRSLLPTSLVAPSLLPALFFGLLASFLSGLAPAAPQSYGIDAPAPIGGYLGGVFPTEAPGSGDSFTPVPAYPALTFRDPLVYTPEPHTNRIALATRQGVIWTFENDQATTTKTPFLDLTDRCAVVWDGGFLGLAFHPNYGLAGLPSSEYVYVFYCYTPDGNYPTNYANNGFFNCFLRISRFTVPTGTNQADPNSELVMMQHRLYNGSHRSGHLAFGPDGFLYVPIGDQFRYETAQDIVNNLEGGIHRIDVDMDPARSHAPRRTLPLSYSDEWSGVGYWIPNDNPFLDPTGSQFEEYYSVGHRNPHRMTFDQVTGELWVGEVGGGLREEINLIERGGNGGWPFREGFSAGPRSEPASYVGTLTEPVVDFLRSESNAIIGGYVYRGARHPGLYGKYICAGYSQRRIFAIERNPVTGTYTKSVIGSFTPGGAITFGQDHDGEIYIGRQNGNTPLYMLNATNPTPDPPQLLSQLGAFTDLAALTPRAGLIPYDLNAPFWSDAALKSRWIAVPNDGSHNTAAEQIDFDARGGNWDFPAGTVAVKHFELGTDETDPTVKKRLETRFVVHTEDGFYAVTYRWNEEGTDAVLQTSRSQETITIETEDGSRDQVWTYPGRQDCLLCHAPVTGGGLGLRTHQLNRDMTYPGSGVVDNQLRTLAHLGIFGAALQEADIPGLPKAAGLTDESASLELRARSYLDTNCSHCHRADASTRAVFDARLETPLYATDLLFGSVADELDVAGARVIQPRETHRSISLLRASALGGIAMPPIAKSLVDEPGVEVLADWIRNLSPSEHVRLGNDVAAAAAVDGWESNMLVNESDLFTNDTGASASVRVEAFRFFAQNTSAPVTPFVVEVLGNDDFVVRAIGATRLPADYRAGMNALPFGTQSDPDGVPTIDVAPGVVLATGFLDATATGGSSGGGSGPGSVIPFCLCNEADTIWYTGGPTGSDSGRVSLGAPPMPGTNLITNFAREYAYTVDLVVDLPNTAPAFGPLDDVTVAEGEYVRFAVEASDGENDILVYSSETLPEGLEMDPELGEIRGWLGATAEGTYPIDVRASDGRADSNGSFTLNVNPQPFQTIYMSFMNGQLLPGDVQVWDEDIAAFDLATGTWSQYFDGSDVGVREDVRGFHILPSGDLLFSFNQPLVIPGLVGGPNGENVDPHDIVKFVPTTLGSNTTGTWEFHFDGSDVFFLLNASAKIDAITQMPDGRLAFSTRGTCQILDRFFRDEDLIAFSGTLGAATAGTGSKVFDGSAVGLGQVNEDLDAAAIDPSGRLLFSVYTESSVPAGGSAALPLGVGDIGAFTGSLTWNTSGTFSGALSAALAGLDGNNVSALHVQ
ncbi:Soluble aldose sugar dehydrogenase YliI precursor [Planctomycetes bacterium Poly30]|uniref:Soluble aldose sugar dehydrogenase YliI n=1 Tax=Saltatorellus ferox TaxID=2528018 RepID=A0A518F113_9BACT|nr:Soluble aldose sugar dehydrogenase YliI precursor [Planctomycetes bacterium Poly30]